MNKTQIANILTPIIGVIATWLGTKVPLLDAATWNTLITTVALAIVTGVLAYFNRATALADTVGKLPGTTVVTTPEISEALPNNPDVIAATPQIVQAVREAP